MKIENENKKQFVKLKKILFLLFYVTTVEILIIIDVEGIGYDRAYLRSNTVTYWILGFIN